MRTFPALRPFMAATSALLLLLAVAPAFATPSTPISGGGWMITQAAGPSQGSAPKVLACGTFDLTVSSTSTDPSASRGTFTGALTFTVVENTGGASIPGSPVPVAGAWYRNPGTGQLLVSYAAAPPSTLTGSFSSPAGLPQPSTPTPPDGCQPLGSGLFGFTQLPIAQHNEGLFVYSSEPVTAL